MKKLLLSIIAIVISMNVFAQENDRSVARVDQIQGVYIFMHCKPSGPYDYIGNVKIGVAWSGKPQEMLELALKKQKKEFPEGNGIIFTSNNFGEIDVIKLK